MIGKMICIPFSKIDDLGRASFMAFWYDHDFHLGPRVRAQAFFCNIKEFSGRHPGVEWRDQTASDVDVKKELEAKK